MLQLRGIRTFSNTGAVISTDGQRHLGAAIGHRVMTYVTSNIRFSLGVMRLNA